MTAQGVRKKELFSSLKGIESSSARASKMPVNLLRYKEMAMAFLPEIARSEDRRQFLGVWGITQEHIDRKLISEHGLLRITEQLAEDASAESLNDFSNSIDAAAIIFGHSILESYVMELLTFSSQAAPDKWRSCVALQKIAVEEVWTKESTQILTERIGKALEDLDRSPLRIKLERLFEVCRPKEIPKYNYYEYSLNRIEEIDKLRHGLVHKGRVGLEWSVVVSHVQYLRDTIYFLVAVVGIALGFWLMPVAQNDTPSQAKISQP